MMREPLGASGKFGKDGLGDVLREGNIAPGFAKGCGMHEINVTFDQLPEGAF